MRMNYLSLFCVAFAEGYQGGDGGFQGGGGGQGHSPRGGGVN